MAPILLTQSKLRHLAALLPLPRAHVVDLVVRLPVLLTLREERLAESYQGLAEVLLIPSGLGLTSEQSVLEPISTEMRGPLPSMAITARLAAAVRGWPELLLVAPAKVSEQVHLRAVLRVVYLPLFTHIEVLHEPCLFFSYFEGV